MSGTVARCQWHSNERQAMRPFEKIQVYHKAHASTLQVYKTTKHFPEDERFGITSQFRRASSSVTLNIVEGRARRTTRDFLRFLNQSKGSLEECEYLLILSKDLGYLPANEFKQLDEMRAEISRMLTGLSNALRKKV